MSIKDLMPDRNIDLRSVGGLIFNEEEHSYHNADGIRYMGMTTFLKQYSEPFDAEGTARYKAIKDNLDVNQMKKLKALITSKLNEPSRTAWTKVHLFYDKLVESNDFLKNKLPETRQMYLDQWNKSSADGSVEHDKREKDVIDNGVTWNGKYYPYMNKNILEVTKDDVCVIPEIMVWDHDKQLCGLIDLPIFDKGVIHILDYKTNKKIEKMGFMGKKMFGPFRFFPDANFYKYSAQLNGYMKMACDITKFEPGETWIISTASKEYKRKEDIYMQCENMMKEINEAFATFKK
jgi:hypothetical protein